MRKLDRGGRDNHTVGMIRDRRERASSGMFLRRVLRPFVSRIEFPLLYCSVQFSWLDARVKRKFTYRFV